jgi:hypothetical protein
MKIKTDTPVIDVVQLHIAYIMLEFPLLKIKVDKWNGTEVVHASSSVAPVQKRHRKCTKMGCLRRYWVSSDIKKRDR